MWWHSKGDGGECRDDAPDTFVASLSPLLAADSPPPCEENVIAAVDSRMLKSLHGNLPKTPARASCGPMTHGFNVPRTGIGRGQWTRALTGLRDGARPRQPGDPKVRL